MIPGGWSEVQSVGEAAGKFRVFDFTFSLTRGYTFWSGVIGGAFLTTATHGTDQLMVQRYFCADTEQSARKALLWSGALVFAQFVLFLLIGVMLFVLLHPACAGRHRRIHARRTAAIGPDLSLLHRAASPGRARGPCAGSDFLGCHVHPLVVAQLVLGRRGQRLLYPRHRRPRDGRHYLNVSRVLTAIFGAIQIAVAIVAISLSSRVVDEVLGIASFTNGVILGVFFLGTFTSVGQRSAFAGIAGGTAIMLAIKLLTAVHWQWYVLIGSIATFLIGALVARALPRK